MACIVLLGTCDTKLDEILFLRQQILAADKSITVILIDVGREDIEYEVINIRPSQLRGTYGSDKSIAGKARGELMEGMAHCATQVVKKMYHEQKIHGIIAVGGSSGTSLASHVMREALPLGFPKLIVSTIASGDTGPIVEETDIMLLYSVRHPQPDRPHLYTFLLMHRQQVVDIAGLNSLLRQILSNAGKAIASMASSYSRTKQTTTRPKKRVGITMFGVTTPAVDAIRRILESEYDIECYVFHATGHGGKAMERLVREGGLDAVLDLTTTEICDYLTGGNMSAGPHRLEAAARAGIPNIISIGATDMTNFGPRSRVLERYQKRQLYEHNSMVTLMRSSVEESRQVGEFIVQKLKEHAVKPEMVEVWLPSGGVSMLSIPGGPFEDAKANSELLNTIKTGLEGSGIAVVEDERAINDEGFAHDIAHALLRKMGDVEHT